MEGETVMDWLRKAANHVDHRGEKATIARSPIALPEYLYDILRDAKRSMARTNNGKDAPNLTSPFHPERIKMPSAHINRNATVNPSTDNHHY